MKRKVLAVAALLSVALSSPAFAFAEHSGEPGLALDAPVGAFDPQIVATVPVTLPLALNVAGGSGVGPSDGTLRIENKGRSALQVESAVYWILPEMASEWAFGSGAADDGASGPQMGAFRVAVEPMRALGRLAGDKPLLIGYGDDRLGGTFGLDWWIAPGAAGAEAGELPLKVAVESSLLARSVGFSASSDAGGGDEADESCSDDVARIVFTLRVCGEEAYPEGAAAYIVQPNEGEQAEVVEDDDCVYAADRMDVVFEPWCDVGSAKRIVEEAGLAWAHSWYTADGAVVQEPDGALLVALALVPEGASFLEAEARLKQTEGVASVERIVDRVKSDSPPGRAE